MLLESQWSTLDCFTSILHKQDLDSYSNDHNKDEQLVVKEVCKHIELVFSNLSTVDLIEDLHEYEGVEDHSVVKTALWGPMITC